MKNCCIVVIGHVDHGKTALVRALTGMETDRLAEEQRRGLSILPGFAHCAYPEGTADFIDAPGHADFVRAMVGGASGAQAALLVISAAKGIAAQTMEHLRIVGLLGIRRGIVALNKSDLMSPDALASRMADVRTALAGTALADAPLVPCSANSGDGLDALHAELGLLVAGSTPPTAPHSPFLAIDRVFTAPGRGVVVTGTLQGAPLTEGDQVLLQPGTRPVTIRSLQSRGAPCQTVAPGARTAANLRGVSSGDIAPGCVLCGPQGAVGATDMDIAVTMLPDNVSPVGHMQQIRVLVGTCAAVARLRLLETPGRPLMPGAQGLARVHFDTPVVAHAGQRAVLRHLSPAQTFGGAVILDPVAPPLRRRDGRRVGVLRAARDADIAGIAAALTAAGHGVALLSDIARLGRSDPDALWPALATDHIRLTQTLILSRAAEPAHRDRMLSALQAFHHAHPLKPLAPRHLPELAAIPQSIRTHLERSLVADGRIRSTEDGIALAGHDPEQMLSSADRANMARIEDALRNGGAAPPALSDLIVAAEDDLLALLIRAGRLVRLTNVALGQTVVFHADALRTAERKLRANFPPPVWFRTSEARTALGTSRKFIVPLLEHFDDLGITRRADALRQMRPARDTATPPPESV